MGRGQRRKWRGGGGRGATWGTHRYSASDDTLRVSMEMVTGGEKARHANTGNNHLDPGEGKT